MIKLIDLPSLGFLIVVPIIIGLLIYFIPKILGYPKASKLLTSIYGITILILIGLIGFEDLFFTKKDAKKLIEEQGFYLRNEFELVDNKSSWAIGDYFHTFSLSISIQDKNIAIENIKNSNDFKKLGQPIDDLLSPEYYIHKGSKQIQNYEDEFSYIREYLEPHGEGYAPTFRRILLSKKDNILTFEDIDE